MNNSYHYKLEITNHDFTFPFIPKGTTVMKMTGGFECPVGLRFIIEVLQRINLYMTMMMFFWTVSQMSCRMAIFFLLDRARSLMTDFSKDTISCSSSRKVLFLVEFSFFPGRFPLPKLNNDISKEPWLYSCDVLEKFQCGRKIH